VPVAPFPIGTVNLDPSQIVYTLPSERNGFDSFESYPFVDQFGDNFGRFVGLNLSVPVFNGFAVSSNVQRAIISKRQAEITYEERSNTLMQTIERAYNDVMASQKSYDASIRQVDAQEESFRVTQRSYELGAMNFIDFQVSQNNLFQANTNLLISKYDYIFKLAILKFYQGELNYQN
jgi:outer membrane protein